MVSVLGADSSRIIDQIDHILEELFLAEARLNKASRDFEDRQRAEAIKHHAAIAPILEHIDKLTDELNAVIEQNRSSLLKRGQRSFVTDIAKLEFDKSSTKARVTDPAMIMEIARAAGITREVAKAVNVWQYDPRKFFRFLRWNRRYRKLFEDYIFRPVSRMVWHIYPLSSYVASVVGDSSQTPNPLTIEVKS